MNTSYVIPQGIIAWRGREKVLPARLMNLGKLGVPLNVISCVWVSFVSILYCIPTTYPITLENMNWIRYVCLPISSMFRDKHTLTLSYSVVIVGLSSYILIAWFTSQRHVFKGPTINIDLLNEARTETMQGIAIIHGVDVKGTILGTPEESLFDSGKVIKGE